MNPVSRLLVVDDELTSRRILHKVLQSAQYEADYVQDGEEALELFKQRPYEMVITDWMMPKMGGAELIKQLRSLKLDGPSPYIIVVSARNEKKDVVKTDVIVPQMPSLEEFTEQVIDRTVIVEQRITSSLAGVERGLNQKIDSLAAQRR